MRASAFTDKLPEVVPPLMDVTELVANDLRLNIIQVYGARVETVGRRQTASISFTNGIPDASGSLMSDGVQLESLANFYRSIVIGDDYKSMERSHLETSLAALVRISERDLGAVPRRTKRMLGRQALWLTRQAVGISLSTGPARYSHGYAFFDKRKPETKIPEHREGYTELLPYMTRKQRSFIEPKLAVVPEVTL